MSQSQLKIAIGLLGVSLLLIFSGELLGGRQGLFWGLSLALSVNILVFFYGDWRVGSSLEGRLLEGQDPFGVLKLSSALAQKTRVAKPEICLISSDSPQILCVGKFFGPSRIFVTTGLFEVLDQKELEAILSLQFVILKKSLYLNLNAASAISDLSLSCGKLLDRALCFFILNKRTASGPLGRIFQTNFARLGIFIGRIFVGPKDFFTLDHEAVRLIGTPLHLASALEKLESYASTKPFKGHLALSPLFAVSPQGRTRIESALGLKPKLKARLDSLSGF